MKDVKYILDEGRKIYTALKKAKTLLEQSPAFANPGNDLRKANRRFSSYEHQRRLWVNWLQANGHLLLENSLTAKKDPTDFVLNFKEVETLVRRDKITVPVFKRMLKHINAVNTKDAV